MASPKTPAIGIICCITMNSTDRLRLIGLPLLEMIPYIRSAIQNTWPLGLQRELDYYGTHEFKLFGKPWMGIGEDAATSRQLIAQILITMAQNGWALLQCSEINRKPQDKDTMFFEKATPDPDLEIFCISFNHEDRIRVIDAPRLMPVIKQVVLSYWKQGIREDETDYFGALELRLNGRPWVPKGTMIGATKRLLNEILACLKSLGYRLYGSVDMSCEGSKIRNRSLDTWFFRGKGDTWNKSVLEESLELPNF